MSPEREEKLKAVLVAAEKLAQDVAADVAELKKTPDTPERRAKLDRYKECLVGVHDALGRLLESTTKFRSNS
jgi:hypothetical protein